MTSADMPTDDGYIHMTVAMSVSIRSCLSIIHSDFLSVLVSTISLENIAVQL